MLKIIDTHAHLNFDVFDNDVNEVIKRAKEKGVEKIIIPSADKQTSKKAFKISQKFENIFMAPGAHPLYLSGAGALFAENGSPSGFYLDESPQKKVVFTLREFKWLLEQKKSVAIGEVGLDYYKTPWRKNIINKEMQLEILKKFFELSLEYNKPLILHIRPSDKSNDAFNDLIMLAKKFKKRPKVVIHCYSSNSEISKKLLDLGFYLSFTYLTFYNKKIQLSFQNAPLEQIMLETDAPFLPPRGKKRNEPAYLFELAQQLAKLKNISFKNLAQTTYQNSQKFFNLGLDKI